MGSGHPAARRRPRRVTARLGTAATALTVAATVLASTVTAAPTLPGWLLLPLEASGMPAHMADPLTVTTSPERAELTISLADYAATQAARESVKAPVEALAAASRSEQRAPMRKTEPAPLVPSAGSAPVTTPGGDTPVLVPDAGEADVPETDTTAEPVPAESAEPQAPADAPEPEPTEPAAEPTPEPVEAPTTEPETAEPPEPEVTEPPVTEPEPDRTPEPAPSPEPSRAPEPEPTEPAPEPSKPAPKPTEPAPRPEPTTPAPKPSPTPSPSPTPAPKPSPTPTPAPSPSPTPKPTPTPTPTPPPAPAPAGDTATARTGLFGLVNAHRANHGLPALQYSGHLQNVAQGWADRLRTIDAVQHSSDYRSRVGCFGSTWGGCSELIIRNTGGARMEFQSLLRWMHGWWVDSAVHNKAMLDPRYTHVGYGFVWSNSGVPYAVAVLAQKY